VSFVGRPAHVLSPVSSCKFLRSCSSWAERGTPAGYVLTLCDGRDVMVVPSDPGKGVSPVLAELITAVAVVVFLLRCLRILFRAWVTGRYAGFGAMLKP
jgi:hypothetical protein